MPSIIPVQEGDKLSFSEIEAYVSRITRAEMLGIDQLNPLVSVCAVSYLICRLVRGAVINN